MHLVIYVYVRAGALARPRAPVWRMHTYVSKAWTGEVGPSLPLRRPPFVSSSSLVPPWPLGSSHHPSRSPSLPPQPLSLSLCPSPFFSLRPASALPPTRLVRTTGVTLHTWHTCKRTRKSAQYTRPMRGTEKSVRKPVTSCPHGYRSNRREMLSIVEKCIPLRKFLTRRSLHRSLQSSCTETVRIERGSLSIKVY